MRKLCIWRETATGKNNEMTATKATTTNISNNSNLSSKQNIDDGNDDNFKN